MLGKKETRQTESFKNLKMHYIKNNINLFLTCNFNPVVHARSFFHIILHIKMINYSIINYKNINNHFFSFI